MKIDLLVAEIGSTTTLVNLFNINKKKPSFIGQGMAPTSINKGDVNYGLKAAINNIHKKLNIQDIEYDEMMASSSAAGGLRMTVHGLVYDMTVKAAKEAALGAGANIHLITAGKMSRQDLSELKKINPNIILLAGGVDYGDTKTALFNANQIAKLKLNCPVIYGGNIQNQKKISQIFKKKKYQLYIIDNVYPKIDLLNIEPARKIIHSIFEEHIIHAPGMKKIKKMINGRIIPTPGAVMLSSQILKDKIGDLITLDVGGATTDVHSVTEGSEEINKILINPEPAAKRTVEGDLGLYINLKNLINEINLESLADISNIDKDLILNYINGIKPVPETKEEIIILEELCKLAVKTAVQRHSGIIRYTYGPNGKNTIAEGKDLSRIKYIIGTGGALTHFPNRYKILKQVFSNNKNKLFPKNNVNILIDNNYIMASLGVLSKKNPEASLKLLLQSLDYNKKGA